MKKILVIDDDVHYSELVRNVLEAHNYKVIIAYGGKEGLEKAKSEKPDLIILDILLPRLNGFKVCQILKEELSTKSIPIIMLTAVYIDEYDKEKALKIGAEKYLLKADIYLSKPVSLGVLINEVKVLLGENPGKDIHKNKILIIDDDPGSLNTLEARLEKEDYEIITSLTGEDGLENVEKEQPNLVILDMKLPGMDGIEVLQKIKEKHPCIPVIMTTAYGNEEIAVETMKKGANDYICKPFSFKEVVVKVKENLEKNKLKLERESLFFTLKESNLKLMERYEKLEEAKSFIEGIFNSIVEVVLVLDIDKRIILVNPTILKVFGYESKEIVGRSFTEVFGLVKPEDMQKVEEIFTKIVETGTLQSPVEMTGFHKDGREIPISIAGALARDIQGNIKNLVCTIRDLSDLKKLMDGLDKTCKELAQSKDYIDNIVKSMIDTLIVIDSDGKIKTINKATTDLLGYKEKELIGKPVVVIFEEEEKEESLFKGSRFKRMIEKGFFRDYDMTYKSKSGEKILVNLSGSVLRDKEGKLVGVLCIARDLREKKEIEGRLLEAEKMATVGQFVAGAAHELNNPLAGITGFSDLALRHLEHDKNPDINKLKKHIKIIVGNTERCNNIVANLLTYGRGFAFDLTFLDINELLDESLALVEHEISLKDVKIVKEYSKDIPQIMASKDPLSHVFINIIRNACQSMPRGGILKIATKVEGDYLEAVFKDNGIGIKEEHLSRLFDPFFTTRNMGEGVGLGLSVSLGIVKSHKGEILVNSEGVGKGASFTIKLPIQTEVYYDKKKRAASQGFGY